MNTPEKNISSEDKPFKSIGYHTHNELTYRGVDWLLNSTIGVSMAYWAGRTESGQRYFGKPVSGFYEAVVKPIVRSEESAKVGGKWGMMITSIMAGGTVVTPLMMALEEKKNKKSIVHAIDSLVYGQEKVDSDPKFAQQYKRIDDEPVKDFSTGMITRVVTLIPFIAVTSIPAANKPFLDHLYQPLGKASRAIGNKLGLASERMLKEGAYEISENTGKPVFVNNWDYLHRTIGFDFGATAIYSVAHEITYKGMAAFKDKQKGQLVHEKREAMPAPEVNLDHSPRKSLAYQNVSQIDSGMAI